MAMNLNHSPLAAKLRPLHQRTPTTIQIPIPTAQATIAHATHEVSGVVVKVVEAVNNATTIEVTTETIAMTAEVETTIAICAVTATTIVVVVETDTDTVADMVCTVVKTKTVSIKIITDARIVRPDYPRTILLTKT